MKSVFIRQKTDKANQIVIVVQRFAGTHYHHIGNSFSCVLLNLINLIQHFGRTQISLQTVQGRRAEPAAHAAAHLGRNAHRIAMFVFHPDAFNNIAVFQGEEIFSGSIYFRNPDIRLF